MITASLVAFNDSILAVCIRNQLSIYSLDTLQSHAKKYVPDKDEVLTCIEATQLKEPTLIFAGAKGKIYKSAMSGELSALPSKHGAAINCIAANKIKPQIVASCSDDMTIRVWCLHSDT